MISYEAIGTKPGPHDDFRVTFTWSEDVEGFTTGDIEVDGADKTSDLTGTGAVYTLDIATDEDLEGEITVTVVAKAVKTADPDDEDDENDRTERSWAVDNKAPELLKATANEFKIVLIYHEEVDKNPSGDAAARDYTVITGRADGKERENLNKAPGAIRLNDDTVTLTLAAGDTIHPGDTVKLTYNVGTNPLQDQTGNPAPPFTEMEVENLRKITRPGPVRNLSASVTDTTIKLDWDQPSDTGGVPILDYRVQARRDGGTYSTLEWAPSQDSMNSEYLHDTLSTGETWTYLVAARNFAGEGDAVEIKATTRSPQPSPPRNLTAKAAGASVIDLSWTAPADTGTSDITGYKIEVSTNAGTSWDDLEDDTENKNLTYKHTGLDAGTTRHYRVSAINGSGAGNPSDTAAATTTSGEPSPPRNLEATADGHDAIDLDWDAPADTGTSRILRYKIEESENGTTWDSIAGTDSTTTVYERTGLDDGTTYHYRVFAINSTGPSGASDTASATTARAGQAPGRPTNLEATADGQTAIDLDWTAPTDTGSSAITGYRIEVSENGTNWTNRVANTRDTTTSYRHTGLTAGSTRHYRVSAINATDTSAASDTASATTRAAAKAPGPPTNLNATADGSNAIDLSWTAPSDTGSSNIVGYRIEASEDDTTSWRVIQSNTRSRTPTTYEHSGLDPGDTYYYRVSAINDDLTGDPSNIDNATTETERPSAPKDLGATAVDSTQIDLAWNPPDDDGGSPITGYRIEMSPNGTSGWSDLEPNTGSDATFYADTTPSPNTTRYYRVSAINDAGEGPASNVANATTSGTVPGRPTNLTAEARDTSQIDLRWREPSENGGSAITGYRIEVSDDGRQDSWVDLVRNTRNDVTNYSHTGLDPGDTVFYRVSAINSTGTGSPSRLATATTLDVPDEPTDLAATANGQTQIDLQWVGPRNDGGSPITGYQIDVSENGGATWSVLVENSRSTSTGYSHTGLSAGETRYYRVRAINEWGAGAYSVPAFATTDASEPGPPLNLVADAAGQRRIDLDWDPPAEDGGADGHRLPDRGLAERRHLVRPGAQHGSKHAPGTRTRA